MNSKLFSLSWKQVGVSLLAAVLIAIWKILGPALDSAVSSGVLVVSWAIVGFAALNAFLTTLVALLLTDESGRPLGIGKK